MTADKGDRRAETKSQPAAAPKSANPAAPRAQEPIEFTLSAEAAATQRVGVVVVGAFADGTLSSSAKALDAASKGKLTSLIGRGELESTPGSPLTLYEVPGVAAERVLLVSLGARDKFDDKAFFKALQGTAKALATGKAHDAAVTLTEVDVPGHLAAWRVQQAARVLTDGAYRFDTPKARTNGGPQKAPGARKITLLIGTEATAELREAMRRGQAIAEGMALTKDLGNLGGNVCNPAYLADTARALGKEFGFDVEVLEREDMAKLGMYSALSVGRASDQPCKFIVMQHNGGPKGQKPIVLVGKGVTFDTGGVSLKPGDDLDMMKYDMSGAGSVLGTMKAVGRLKLPVNVIGIVAAVENMPGGNATRPGDVVTSMSGLTIEILNTDAEGRLVLCDALTYAERFAPECVIDIATLTGACVIALGSQTSGLFANDEGLAEELFECGTDTGDRAWPMPLWDEYQDQLKSNFADMSNLGGRPAGSVTAACFLSRFAQSYDWAHLDIAGTASVGGDAKGATGRPVPLLSEFLLRRSGQQTAAGSRAAQ